MMYKRLITVSKGAWEGKIDYRRKKAFI